jgi:integrase
MESSHHWEPWNKGKLVGQKPPLKPKDIWAIRIQLQNTHQVRDLAMFNLAIDSKLRGCDLVNLHVRDITHGSKVLARAMVVQRKTQRPVQFELTEPTRAAVTAWIEKAKLKPEQCLFPVAFPNRPMSQRDSTPASCISGLPPSDSIRRSMARTQCGGPRRH